MKNQKFIYSINFAASTLFACSVDDESPVPDNKGTKSISVSLAGLSGVKTKSTEAGSFLTADTMNVNSILINLADGSGTVVKSETITKDATTDSNWDKLVSPDKGIQICQRADKCIVSICYGIGSAVRQQDQYDTRLNSKVLKSCTSVLTTTLHQS